MRRLTRPLLILLAIVFLIEAWLWRHLEPIVEWIVARIPLRAVKAWVAGTDSQAAAGRDAGCVRCSGHRAVSAEARGLWLLAHKQWFAAGMVIVLAKLVGVAVTAFVFEVTKPKLLKLNWFRWLYEHVLVWLDWAHQLVAPIRQRIRRTLRIFRPKRAGRALRLLWRIRRRMRASRGGAAPGSEQMHRVRREQPNRHEGQPDQAEAAGQIAQRT